jgi:organic hydroperoxide reductase OsmC/OhrA
MNTHIYETVVHWTAEGGEGTKNYRSYPRDHTIRAGEKNAIRASSDPAFRGDASRYNPEELLVASLSSCHMLWYLHLCSANGVTVTEYRDAATGTLEQNPDGSGQFSRVLLHPMVTVTAESDVDMARDLHAQAHELCFIARSVNFPVEVTPTIT